MVLCKSRPEGQRVQRCATHSHPFGSWMQPVIRGRLMDLFPCFIASVPLSASIFDLSFQNAYTPARNGSSQGI
jgi:hypothetical protein